MRYNTNDNYPQINMLQNINFKASPANTQHREISCFDVVSSLKMKDSPASFDNVLTKLKVTL